MSSILDRVYPDKWDLNNNEFTILFKDVEITNARNNTLISNIYVRMKINNSGNISSDLSGMVPTMSIEQYDSSYTHSHLSTSSIGNWGGYCLGSTDMSSTMRELSVKFNSYLFEALLYRLPDYLAWESISGGPYRRISGIRLNGASRRINVIGSKVIIKNILLRINSIPLEVKKNKIYNSIVIDRSNIEFEKEVYRAYMECGLINSVYESRKDPINNIYIGLNSESTSQLKNRIETINGSLGDITFEFKGVTRSAKVITEIKINNEDDSIMVLNEGSFKNICDYIDSKLLDYKNFKQLKEDEINKEISTSSIT